MSDVPTIKQLNDAIALVANFACEHLPEDWRIIIDCERGACGVVLRNYAGDEISIADDDRELGEMIVMRIDHARDADGLQVTGLLDDSDNERFLAEISEPREDK